MLSAISPISTGGASIIPIAPVQQDTTPPPAENEARAAQEAQSDAPSASNAQQASQPEASDATQASTNTAPAQSQSSAPAQGAIEEKRQVGAEVLAPAPDDSGLEAFARASAERAQNASVAQSILAALSTPAAGDASLSSAAKAAYDDPPRTEPLRAPSLDRQS